jgi:hypothetical protein
MNIPDQRRQHAVGNVGHKADVVALERLQHHLVPALLTRGLGRGLSLGSRHRILPYPATIFRSRRDRGRLVKAPKLDAIHGIVNMSRSYL